MTQLTTRSKVALRWSTDPRHFGKGFPTLDIMTMNPDLVSSPRLVLEELEKVRSKVGHGVEMAVHFTLADGTRVSRQELEQVVFEAYCLKSRR